MRPRTLRGCGAAGAAMAPPCGRTRRRRSADPRSPGHKPSSRKGSARRKPGAGREGESAKPPPSAPTSAGRRTLRRAALRAPRAVTRTRVADRGGPARCARRRLLLLVSRLVVRRGRQGEVTGLDDSERQVTAALTAAAEEMTTLNVDEAELGARSRGSRRSPSIAIDPDFPHRPHDRRSPSARPSPASATAEAIAVAGDGTVLPRRRRIGGPELPADRGRRTLPPRAARRRGARPGRGRRRRPAPTAAGDRGGRVDRRTAS